MKDMWVREGNVWRFIPVPGVTISPFLGKWHAYLRSMPMREIQPSKSSDTVKRAVWEYFDKRVNL